MKTLIGTDLLGLICRTPFCEIDFRSGMWIDCRFARNE